MAIGQSLLAATSPCCRSAASRKMVGREVSRGASRLLDGRTAGRRKGAGSTDRAQKKNEEPGFRAFQSCPRECRQAGILNLGSDRSLPFRIRYARLKGHTQQRFPWSATNANLHWFKESMTLTNTAGNSLGACGTVYGDFKTAASSVSMCKILRLKRSLSSPVSDSIF